MSIRREKMVLRKQVKEIKKVSFDSNVKIFNMHVWSFAYNEARKSDWMTIAADRYRFELRKQRLEAMLATIGFFLENRNILNKMQLMYY